MHVRGMGQWVRSCAIHEDPIMVYQPTEDRPSPYSLSTALLFPPMSVLNTFWDYAQADDPNRFRHRIFSPLPNSHYIYGGANRALDNQLDSSNERSALRAKQRADDRTHTTSALILAISQPKWRTRAIQFPTHISLSFNTHPVLLRSWREWYLVHSQRSRSTIWGR